MKSLIYPLALSSFIILGEAAAEDIKYSAVTIRHIENGGVGYNTGYSTLQAFLSANPSLWKVTPFLDLRGHVFDDGKFAANAGIGIRTLFEDRIYGINTYYDYRHTTHLNYNQASVGLETLGRFIDARINGYFPCGSTTSAPYDIGFSRFSGHQMILKVMQEFAMTGADAEVGFHFGKCSDWNFYGITGPYYYRGPLGGNAWGGKVRVQATYKQHITLEVIESYDNVFHNHVQGQISFSIPLGKSKKSRAEDLCLARRMAQPVQRNEIIVVDHKHQYPVAMNPATKTPYYFVFVDNTSASSGTYESPYHSLVQAQDNSLAHQILYLFPGDGTTKNMDQGIVLKESQKLWGSGCQHPIETTLGLVTIPQMTLSSPQITNTNLQGSGVTLSTHNDLSGLTIRDTSAEGISGNNPESFSLSFCTVTGCGLYGGGIRAVNITTNVPFSGNFDHNTLINNPDAAVYVEFQTGASLNTLLFTNNYAENNNNASGDTAAIFQVDPNGAIGPTTLYASGNTIINNGTNGGIHVYNFHGADAGSGSFSMFRGVFIENIITNNGSGIAYTANGDHCILSFFRNVLSNNQRDNVSISQGGTGSRRISTLLVTLDANQLNGSILGNGIDLSTRSDLITCSLTNNSIINNHNSGINFYIDDPSPPELQFRIVGNTIMHNLNAFSNAAGGISIDGFRSLDALISYNQLSQNSLNSLPANAIGHNGASTTHPSGNATVAFQNNTLTDGDNFQFEFFGDSPITACLSVTENISNTTPTAYNFYQQGTGACYLIPCNFSSENTGDFDLIGVTPSSHCSGDACK